MIRDDLTAAIQAALVAAGLPEPDGGITLEAPRKREHGDWATNVALRLGPAVGAPTREVAARIRDALAGILDAPGGPPVEGIEIAGAGFLNFRLGDAWLHDVLRAVVAAGAGWGRGDELAGARVNLEFVSANPTGPLHAGGARWVAVGDAIANLLAARGAEVHREYYLNDAGNQLDVFAESLHARYRGEQPPDDGYRGEYLVEMAHRLRAERGDGLGLHDVREWGYHDIVAQLRADLGRLGVHFDTWFSERSLHERGDVGEVLQALRDRGHLYERDGATWLASEALGDQRDRVLVKADGATTYLCNDLAYHRDKFARGFTHLVDIWGADHHGQVKSVQVGLEALGFPAGEPEIILGQLVSLVRDGQEVRISKRTGNIVTLADILDDLDPDVARLTFLLQGVEKPQTLDLDVASAQSMENPVYYVQMAHARIASIARRGVAEGVVRRPLAEVDLAVLTDARELDVLRAIAAYPDVVADAAATRAPHKVTAWVHDLAGRFHRFYAECRVLTDDEPRTQARLWLAEAARIGLADALGLLGVSVPDEMARLEEPSAT